MAVGTLSALERWRLAVEGGTNTIEPTTETGSRVGVLTTFTVSPGYGDAWTARWAHLARIALTWPGCFAFRVVRDRNDDMYVAVYSEWSDMDAYNGFVRSMEVIWMERTMGGSCTPAEVHFLDIVPLD
jgi:heme-degrading monooxygenase HmoA